MKIDQEKAEDWLWQIQIDTQKLRQQFLSYKQTNLLLSSPNEEPTMYNHPSTLLNNDYCTDNVLFIPHDMPFLVKFKTRKEAACLLTSYNTNKLIHLLMLLTVNSWQHVAAATTGSSWTIC